MNHRGIKNAILGLVLVLIAATCECHALKQVDLNVTANDFETLPTIGRPTKPRPAILLYGDSITEYGADVSMQGWTALLSQTYIRSVDVINRGLSSYNTTNFINLVLPGITDEIASQYKPVLIALWLGTNDAALVPGPSASQHVAVDQYMRNLVTIVNQFKTLAPQAKILVITPAVIDDAARLRAANGGLVDRSNAASQVYAAACVNAVKGLASVTVLDLYTFMMTTYPDAAVRATLLSDGLHLSASGNRVVFEQVNQRVKGMVSSTVLQTPQFPYF